MSVLITGAAGNVASLLRPGLPASSGLRVTDTRDVTGWGAAEVVLGDLADPSFAAEVVDGMDAVIHLAASPLASAPWKDLRVPNVEAAATLLDAAASAGVGRVVLASSVHVMGGYAAPGVVIDPSWPVLPCCRYGATKAFAEAYGAVIARTTGTSVICLRLGLCMRKPTTTGNLPEWLAPADLQQLVGAALTAEVRFGAYPGVSANTRPLFDLSGARADLGYEPRHDSEVYAEEVRQGPAGLCPR